MASQCRVLFFSSLAGMSLSEPMGGRLRGAVLAEQSCRQAVEGGECHGAVKWAKDVGIFQHPEWYPDLTPDSPVEDFQAHLHSINHGNCPQPCNATSMTLPPATPVCHTAVEGEACYGAVKWAADTGIFQHPEWYPDLTPDSPVEDFQAHLHSINDGNCPEPCNATSVTPPPATPVCHTAIEGEDCYGAVTWAMDTDSATARVDYFVNNSDCSGTPYSSMVIPTTIGTELIDGCRDIYGNLWTNYACRARWDA